MPRDQLPSKESNLLYHNIPHSNPIKIPANKTLIKTKKRDYTKTASYQPLYFFSSPIPIPSKAKQTTEEPLQQYVGSPNSDPEQKISPSFLMDRAEDNLGILSC